jgi:hypothetical protein
MKKIGFIDYFIDEWHANTYPGIIRGSSFKDRMDIALAWEEIHPEGKKHIDDWCTDFNVQKASSIKQVVDECDYLIVLSPDNGERHEDLADIALRSGKPVYIDKPIATSLAAAERMYEKAQKHGTPLMSSSALRFGSNLHNAVNGPMAKEKVRFVTTLGSGVFHNYAIHQVEMVVATIGIGAKRVLQFGNDQAKAMAIDYGDGRRGVINLLPEQDFELRAVLGDGKYVCITDMADIFDRFVDAMLAFFESGKSVIPVEQTLEIAALIEAGEAALKTPDLWSPVPGHSA